MGFFDNAGVGEHAYYAVVHCETSRLRATLEEATTTRIRT